MQGLWYGDKRDRVKWGALVCLATKKDIPCIVQVAYFRHGPELMLQLEEVEVPLPEEVWEHFSDLNHIKRLEKKINLMITVIGQEFKPENRRNFIKDILQELKKIKCRKIVFLDPDTGIEPKNSKPEHVTTEDLQEIWANEALLIGDLLVVYQHADRTKKWLPDRKKTMSNACGGADVKTITGKGIASDVAMLWCCKGPTNEGATKRVTADPKPAKTAKKGRLCACPCGELTKGGYFCPGHDAKLKSIFLKVIRDKKGKNELDKIRLRMYEIWKEDKLRPLMGIAAEILG